MQHKNFPASFRSQEASWQPGKHEEGPDNLCSTRRFLTACVAQEDSWQPAQHKKVPDNLCSTRRFLTTCAAQEDSWHAVCAREIFLSCTLYITRRSPTCAALGWHVKALYVYSILVFGDWPWRLSVAITWLVARWGCCGSSSTCLPPPPFLMSPSHFWVLLSACCCVVVVPWLKVVWWQQSCSIWF